MQKKITLIGITIVCLNLACSLPFDAGTILSTGTPTLTFVPTETPIPTPTQTATPLPPTATAIPEELLESGDRALFNGDWERAVQEYQVAYQSSMTQESQAAALLGLGRAWLMARNFYQATAVFEKLVLEYSTSPLAAQAYFHLGEAYSAQERPFEAAGAYLNYLALRPGLIDAYILELRGDALFTYGDTMGAARDYQAAQQSPSQLDAILLGMKAARAYAVGGDYPTALTLYDDLYYRAQDDNTRALIDYRKGQAYTALGQTELAHAAYLEAVTNYPTAYESYLALVELVDAGVAVDELQRGIVDYHAAQYGVALSAFDRYLQNNPPDPAKGHYYYGLANRALGGYEEAIQHWEVIIQNFPDHPLWDEAWEQKAYTQWAYLEQYPQAVQTLLDFAEKNPAHLRAGEFLFDAAQVSERAGDLPKAAELFERVINLYPGYENALRSLFLAGITNYRLGLVAANPSDHFQAALLAFLRYSGLVSTLEERAMASFWVGKAQAALGDEAAARSTWETTASIDSTGYYSERARDILHQRQPFQPPVTYDLGFDINEERLKASQWLQTTFGLSGEIEAAGLGYLASEPALQRGTELWKLGLYDQARMEFENLRLAVAADAVSSFQLANYLLELGLYRPAIQAARQVLNLALLGDAESLNAPVYFNHLRFGTYYQDIILPLADRYQFHPLLLFALVRQESLFEGFVRSSAGARGLMQIMPNTGADIQKNLGWPPEYSDEDLYLPLVSLTFGVDYLNTQRQAFGGDLYAALAAYNGGPGNAAAWQKLAPNDPDLFLEIIRYEETRKYIRGVYELYTIYRLIYERIP